MRKCKYNLLIFPECLFTLTDLVKISEFLRCVDRCASVTRQSDKVAFFQGLSQPARAARVPRLSGFAGSLCGWTCRSMCVCVGVKHNRVFNLLSAAFQMSPTVGQRSWALISLWHQQLLNEMLAALASELSCLHDESQTIIFFYPTVKMHFWI